VDSNVIMRGLKSVALVENQPCFCMAYFTVQRVSINFDHWPNVGQSVMKDAFGERREIGQVDPVSFWNSRRFER
jgi:Na+/alanine symporter